MADTASSSHVPLRTQRQAMIDECKALKVRLGDELPAAPPTVPKKTPVAKPAAAKLGNRGPTRR
jgi:hypothetical protein